MSSYSTPNQSEWVEFTPYGETNKAGWPLDEMMDDIEQQMDQQDDAMNVMRKQLEDIEVSLSVARNRQPKTRKLSSTSSTSRFSVPFVKKNYISMENDGNTHGERPMDDKVSILQILQRRSELRGNDDQSHHTREELVPPSQLPTSRRFQARSKPSPVNARLSSPQVSEVPPPISIRHLPRTPSDLRIAKPFRSSSTWGESESSHQSSSSDDLMSEMEETTDLQGFIRPCWGSRKLKICLAVLISILILMIGILSGLWVQQNKAQKHQSLSEQTEKQRENSPVFSTPVVPNITSAPNDHYHDESSSSHSQNSVPSEILQVSTNAPTQNPTMSPTNEPTNAPIKVLPAANDAANDETSVTTTPVYKYDYTANSDFLVGVYYYPWHGERFHNGGGYMRKELSPPHLPTLGEYNDSDPAVISHHMKWFRQANIGLLVTSWWGPNRLEDSNTKDVIMQHEDVGNLKIALHYETTSRLGDGREKLPNARTDIKYMCENYFDHPNYYKIDGRPVLFIYISRKLHTVGTLEEALLTMRSTASKCGHNIYLIGDSVFESAPDPNEPHVPFWYFDAVTNYDVYGSSGRPEGHVGADRVDNYYRHQNEWKEQASREDCRYIPAVSPGYNDRGVRMQADHPPLSRRLSQGSQEGSLFHYQLKQAKQLVDSKVDNMILVNSFNEWHEDTQIEPVMGSPATQPFNFTKGLEYVGYGELYLNILGAATSRDTSRHTVFDYLF